MTKESESSTPAPSKQPVSPAEELRGGTEEPATAKEELVVPPSFARAVAEAASALGFAPRPPQDDTRAVEASEENEELDDGT